MRASGKYFFERLKAALPFIFMVILLLGGGLLVFWGYREDVSTEGGRKLQNLYYTVGAAGLSGGLFGAVLKSLQFLGIFQVALENIVLTNKDWLSTLSDARLRKLWADTTHALVVKGFPELSANLSDGIFRQMVPGLEEFYYSKMYRRLDILSYDPETDMLIMKEEFELVINAHADVEVPYAFELASETGSLTITYLSIDGEDVTKNVKNCSCEEGGSSSATQLKNKIYTSEVCYSTKLKGKNKYSVRRHHTRHVKLSSDPVAHVVSRRFVESMVVAITNGAEQHIRVRPFPIGIPSESFKPRQEGATMLRIDVDQLLFPGDGLLLVFERSQR